MRVVINSAHLMAGTIFCLTNIFGMVLDDERQDSHIDWLLVACLATSGAALLFTLFMTYLNRMRLGPSHITS